MKNKYLLIMVFLVAILSLSFVQAVSDSDLKVILKRVMFEHISGVNKSNTSLTLAETKGLMIYYLSSPQNRSEINLSYKLPNNTQMLQTVFEKAIVRLTERNTLTENDFAEMGGEANRNMYRNTVGGNISACVESWKCATPFHRKFQKSDCTWGGTGEFCTYGCGNGTCLERYRYNNTDNINNTYRTNRTDNSSINSSLCGPCPQYVPPSPDWCKNGTIVAGSKDKCGCIGTPKCVNTSDTRNNDSVDVPSYNGTQVTNRVGSCTDSDQGLNYNMYGYTYWNGTISSKGCIDSCYGSYVVECYCTDNGDTTTKKVPCENGCANGACQANQTYTGEVNNNTNRT
ncbi:MAG: hypothetical protein ACP5NW_04980 [Candidatus Woesearchaeota archaeon]